MPQIEEDTGGLAAQHPEAPESLERGLTERKIDAPAVLERPSMIWTSHPLRTETLRQPKIRPPKHKDRQAAPPNLITRLTTPCTIQPEPQNAAICPDASEVRAVLSEATPAPTLLHHLSQEGTGLSRPHPEPCILSILCSRSLSKPLDP